MWMKKQEKMSKWNFKILMGRNKVKFKRTIYLTTFFLILFCTVFTTTAFADKTYTINKVDIYSNVNADGSLTISETRQYKFNGNFHGCYIDINKKGFENLKDVSVEDVSSNKLFTLKKSSDTEEYPPGKFEVTEQDGKYRITWYFNEKNTVKVYKVMYKVLYPVKLYTDTADLNHIFIGKDWQVPQKNINILIELPQKFSRNEVSIFGHGPLEGKVAFKDDKTVEYSLSCLDPGELLEARVLFPASFITNTSLKINEAARSKIMSEELNLAKKSDEERKSNDENRKNILRGIFASLIAALMLFIISVIVIRKNYKEKLPKILFDGEYYRDFPSDDTPGEAGYMIGSGESNLISSTILNLKYKGYIDIIQNEKSGVGSKIGKFLGMKDKSLIVALTGKNPGNLVRSESLIYGMISDAARYEDGDMRKYIKKNAEDAYNTKNAFSELLDGELEAKSYYERFAILDGKTILKLSMAIILISLAIAIILKFPFSFVFFLPVFLYVILRGSIKTRINSSKGGEIKAKWMALKNFMEDFSALKERELPELSVWEGYLIYAAAFGTAEKLLKQLKIVYPDFENTDFYYNYYNTVLMCSVLNNITSSISNPAVSGSSIGGGGGFSGGGGSGSGGGGGGAF